MLIVLLVICAKLPAVLFPWALVVIAILNLVLVRRLFVAAKELWQAAREEGGDSSAR
ncbi:MAG: hypothetical protein KDC98_23020 [Planctomycetes bacterium]|nr:hypothetical protein [Planctomycetota bacterium]